MEIFLCINFSIKETIVIMFNKNEFVKKEVIKMKERNQLDKFLHEIQKEKMKEVWDNKYDEIWENE